MSHSTVLVIGEDPEVMLEPYDENTQVETYPSYDDAETPQKFWYFDAAMEHGLGTELGKTAAEVTWPELVEFLNGRWKDEEPYVYDPERNRMYQMSTYNLQSKWDWYSLGGRWTGHFKLTDDAVYGRLGQSGVSGNQAKPGWVDQARKRDIDWNGMRAQAEAEAISQHAQIRAVLAGTPQLIRWSTVRERFPDSIEAARQSYRIQPGIVALHKAKLDPMMDDPVELYHLDAEDPLTEYVSMKRRNAALTFAILDKDGWHERAHMGWFGLTSDEKDDWPETATQLMDQAGDLDLFSVYDVHI